MVPGAVSHTILCCQGWGLASWRVPASLGRNLEQSLGELKLGRMRDGCSLKPFLIVLPLPNFSPGFTSAWVPFNPCQVECGSWEETQAGEAELIQTQICCAVRMCCCGEKSLLPVASCSLSQRPGLCPRPLPLPAGRHGEGVLLQPLSCHLTRASSWASQIHAFTWTAVPQSNIETSECAGVT